MGSSAGSGRYPGEANTPELRAAILAERRGITAEEFARREQERRAKWEAEREAARREREEAKRRGEYLPEDRGAERRTCLICKNEYPIYWFEKEKGKRGPNCIDCKRIKRRLWGRTSAGAAARARHKWRLRDVLDDYKRKAGCKRCGESDPVALDFHHLDPGTKEGQIGELVGRRASIERIRAELAKCLVLCANCHRKFHHGRYEIDSVGRIREPGKPRDMTTREYVSSE